MTSPLHTLLCSTVAALIGAASAVAVTITVGTHDAPEPVDASVQRNQELRRERSSPASTEPSGASELRITRVERQLDGLTANLERERDPVSPPAEAEPPLGMDEQDDAAEQAWQASVDRHREETVDSDWSSRTRAAFEEDIEAAVDGAADAIEVECRSESCLASVQFPSFHDATGAFTSLLQYSYRSNCATSVAAPEPEDPSEPYATSILFHCDDAA